MFCFEEKKCRKANNCKGLECSINFRGGNICNLLRINPFRGYLYAIGSFTTSHYKYSPCGHFQPKEKAREPLQLLGSWAFKSAHFILTNIPPALQIFPPAGGF